MADCAFETGYFFSSYTKFENNSKSLNISVCIASFFDLKCKVASFFDLKGKVASFFDLKVKDRYG